MNKEPLLSVAEARARILSAVDLPRGREDVPLAEALNRTLVADLVAKRTQPPIAVAAMDGYALRAEDIASLPARLKCIGESAAGRGFIGSVGAGEAVRIFTGAPLPEGANAVLMQEDARRNDDIVEPLRSVPRDHFIRPAGMDFREGDLLLHAGKRLSPADIALAAAMNHARLPVSRKPRIAILATGDELVAPGTEIGANRVVASNSYAIAAYARSAGGEPIDLGIAGDDLEALAAGIAAARDTSADVLVTLGGASVGDYDLVKTALAEQHMALDFWQIAMRPGKPLIYGRLGETAILGLPGNPVAAVVCCILFLLPLVRALSGDPSAGADEPEPALLGAPLRANDSRQDYLRATLARSETMLPVATLFTAQDSSLLGVLARAQCLVVRPPHAPAAEAGEICHVIRLPGVG